MFFARPYRKPNRSLQQRLDDSSVPDPTTGCRLWMGTGGYGTIGVSGRMIGAHRAAWIARHGPIPPGLHVCHRCDNPRCINPDHLFLGTHQANMRDMSMKMKVRKRAGGRRVTGNAPDIMRLEFMGQVIISQIVAVRPLEQEPAVGKGNSKPN